MENYISISRFSANKNLFSLCLASFIILSGYTVIIPFFPIYANDILTEIDVFGLFTLGIALQIGIITSSNMFTRFLLAPSFGDLSDEKGRKPLIMVGMLLYTLSMMGFSLATNFLTLFIIRALSGIASAAVWPVSEALIVDSSEEDNRGRNLGYFTMSTLAGLTAGPFVGFTFFYIFNGLLGILETYSYRLTFVCVSIMGLIATLVVSFYLIDPKQKEDGKKSYSNLYGSAIRAMWNKSIRSPIFLVKNFSPVHYRTRSLYALYLASAANGFVLAIIVSIAVLFLEEHYFLDATSIALIVGIAGVASLLGAPIGGQLSDKYFGQKKTVWVSGIVSGFILLFISIEMGVLMAVLLFSVQRFIYGINQPAFKNLQSILVPEIVRGKEFGLVQALFNLGAVIGPIIGGFLYDIFNDVYYYGAGLQFIGAGVIFLLSGLILIIASILLMIFID